MEYLALSDEQTFLVSGRDGDIPGGGDGLGLYHRDMRHLSVLELRLGGAPLRLLSSGDDDVYRNTILMSNPYVRTADGGHVSPGSVGVTRSRVVSGAVYERLLVTNYGRRPLALHLELLAGADFADLFEVRGFPRGRTGRLREPERDEQGVLFSYEGGDGVARRTRLSFSVAPDEASLSLDEPEGDDSGETASGETTSDGFRAARVRLVWRLELGPREEWELEIGYEPTAGDMVRRDGRVGSHDAAAARLAASYGEWLEGATRVETDDEDLNRLLRRSALDLRALSVSYPTGRLPVAGIPWYAVPFGRDSAITALQTLCFRPELTAGTLRFLAAHQGEKDDPWRDEEPGRIMHELRFGELAGTGRVPHTPYYGSVDSTPLFVMLFAQAMRWTGDRALYAELMPNVRRALEWMDTWGDRDGDGYVEFSSRSEAGIRYQGWKDSGDSLLYPDGTPVEPPAALVEVQAYVHAAKAWLAPVAAAMGDGELARRLEGEAAALRGRLDRDYWVEGTSCYAQALDSQKRPTGDVTSNAGHALIGGVAPPERARQVAARLLAPDMASGWGVRTRSAGDPSYNPMSYHNGSVWPHDNSLVAWGMAMSGLREEANEVARQVLAAAPYFRLSRLPELYCGYGPGETGLGRPAEYPVSCSPQAWAAGTPYLLLQSMLGLEPDALSGTLRVRPHLPEWLGSVELRGLRVGEGRAHLRVTHEGAEVLRAEDVEVEVG